MNARLYDPVVGRFLSPDPYVQAPDFSQNFNRYSYALNNPLRYTDPNGEFLPIIPLAIVVGAAFTTGYVTHGITTGNWGMAAIYSGGLSAIAAGIGASTMGVGTVSGALVFAGQDVANTILSNIIEPINVPLWNGASLSVSPVAMLTAGVSGTAGGGFRLGMGMSVSQQIGDWTLTAGMSAHNGGSNGNIFGGISYDDGKNGFSYYHTAYLLEGSKQRTGTFGARSGDFSLQWENDAFAKSGDKFRSNAIEFGYKGHSIGTNVYTTHGVKDVNKKINGSDLWNNNHGTHDYGWTLSSPLYIGIRNGKRGVTRIGYNHPVIGDFVQNGFHHIPGIDSPNFKKGNFSSVFIQQGISTSYSLY